MRVLCVYCRPLPDLPARDRDDDDDPKAAATAVEAQRRRWNARKPCGQNLDHQRDIGAPRAAYECPVYVDSEPSGSRRYC